MKSARRALLKAFVAAGLSSAFRDSAALGGAPNTAEWLILVYMNGKNNLVSFALQDFLEMASVGSTDAVSVVVQLGRPEKGNHPTYDAWSGVKRYFVKKDMKPSVDEALMHVADAKDPKGDMGSPAVLDEFVAWALAKYPTRKKLLVIWNHGQGWRFQAHPSTMRFAAATRALTRDEASELSDARIVGTYRSVSSDDDHRSILYNKQVQTLLERRASEGIRFNIVAYDACLMSMIETAYSLRNCTDYLIGSQELEPGAGWDHGIFLKKLIAKPSMNPEEVARTVVESYQERYGNYDMTTLSAVRLKGIQNVCQTISVAAKALMNDRDASYPVLAKVRGSLRAFADYEGVGFGVDCESLFERIAATSVDPAVKNSAIDVAAGVKSLIVANYASDQTKAYSPRGLAIYFPLTRSEFERDPDSKGYLRSNAEYTVDFVQDVEWPVLLKDYLKL